MKEKNQNLSREQRTTFKEFVINLFEDERGRTSIKPVISFVGSMFLCATLIVNLTSSATINLSDALINAIMVIVSVGMSGDTIDKFSYKKPINRPIVHDDGGMVCGETETTSKKERENLDV